MARLVDDLGPVDATAVLESDNRPPAVTLRANPDRTDPIRLAEELRAAGVRVEPGELLPDALVVTGIGDPASLAAVAEGRATPQDQASQSVVAALDPQTDEQVLEIAAAPGAKTTAIAERVGAGSDRSWPSIATPLGWSGSPKRPTGSVSAASIRSSPTAAPSPSGPATFDRILVDAPCSGLGVLRRRPEARWRLDPGAPEQLAAPPTGAARSRRRRWCDPVGSSCTRCARSPRSRHCDVDAWAERALDGFDALSPPGPPWRSHGRGALLLPSAAGTDGMFVLVLRSAAVPVPPPH